MKPEEIVKQHLPKINVMQLATSLNDQPWVCTVHYCSDEDLNLYWISRTDRYHSEQIKQNPQAAATILVHENTPDEDYVIGISIFGNVELIGEAVDEKVGKTYTEKLGKPLQLIEDIASGKNPHKFYCLKPTQVVLFDSKNFPDSPRQIII